MMAALDQLLLPRAVRARIVENVNGLSMHMLEAGDIERPTLLLLHGFPEIAYSWRKIMPALADAGFHVIAPDQRGYGRTTGWDGAYNGDVDSFRYLNLVTDAVALLSALGLRSVASVVGHDFGSPVAAWCALIRPDIFRSVVLMSAPFAGPPSLPFDTAGAPQGNASAQYDIRAALAALNPPRKHYQWYYSTREANDDMLRCPQGVHAFLRAYFHCKSADLASNRPYPLKAWNAEEIAKLPAYYVMDADKDMALTVAAMAPTREEIDCCAWMTDKELAVYAEEYERVGFQGGLQWYRCGTEGRNADLSIFSGRKIEVPACFIAGSSDWGIHQRPGAFEAMQKSACADWRGAHLIDGAGHWVQQEQPMETARLVREFLDGVKPA